ncbi:MAG: BON domain-containing protein [Desulfobacterales bacterium]
MLKARLVWNKFKAEDLLSNMTGIVEIINKLVVVPTETRIDQAIYEEITVSLERNIHGELKEVNVQVEDQVVTLTGKVPGWEIYHLVRDVLSYTLGVIDVRNMLLAQNVSSLMENP